MRFFKSKTFRIIVALVIVFTSFAAFTGSYNKKANAGCAHNWCNIVYIQSADCTRQSVTYCRCTKCGVYQYVYGDALGHNWQLVTTIQSPTCTTAGAGFYRCTRCGTTSHMSIPALGHLWASRVVCGYREYYCKRCGISG